MGLGDGIGKLIAELAKDRERAKEACSDTLSLVEDTHVLRAAAQEARAFAVRIRQETQMLVSRCRQERATRQNAKTSSHSRRCWTSGSFIRKSSSPP